MTNPYQTAERLEWMTGRVVFIRRSAVAQDQAAPRVLLLHGNPGSLLDWMPLYGPLSAVAEVVAVDLPGFGRSPKPPGGPESLSLECLATDVIAVADALGWTTPFFIAGHSHGGGVAQIAAALRPERVAGIVLLGTLGAPAHSSYRVLSWRPLGLPVARAVLGIAARTMRTRVWRPLAFALVQRAMRPIYSPERVTAQQAAREFAVISAQPHILHSMVDVTLGEPSLRLLENAPRIHCPTLFLHGERDALVPMRHARKLHEQIILAGGHSRFTAVPGAGHMLMAFQTRFVTDAITGFMLEHALDF